MVCAALMLAVAGLTAVSCGKKGPPLAPLMRVPAPVEEFSARRLGATVYLRFVVPARNQDNSTPADLTRVEVYGYTGKPASDEDIVKYGTRVASVAVRPPPREDEDRTRKPKSRDGGGTPGLQAGGGEGAGQSRATEREEPGFEQGAAVTLTEALTPELMQPVVVRQSGGRKKVQEVANVPTMLGIATFDDTPSRVYIAVGVNRKQRRGVFSPRAAVPVVALPPPPTGLQVTYTEREFTLVWTPPPGAPPVTSSKADGAVLRGRPIVPSAAPSWSYDVFEVAPPAPAQVSAGSPAAPRAAPEMPRVEPPTPVNRQPVPVPAFTDPRMEFGAERCYSVRTVNLFGKLQQASEQSETVCVTPRDTFAPEPPRGLIAVASDGVISLSWDPNSERDLAGYVILRGEEPGAPLQPITREPIQATTFEDKTVKAGVRYVYAVVAVDKASPPNTSRESNRIEETAR